MKHIPIPKLNIPFKPLRHNIPNEVITDYILFQPELYHALIEYNSAFFDENERYMSVCELAKKIEDIIHNNFTSYTEGDVPEKIVIRAMLANVDYNKVSIQMYSKLCNDTTSYRITDVMPTPAEYYSMTLQEYENGMQNFFENKYLNF